MHKLQEKYFTFMNYYQKRRIVQKPKSFSLKQKNAKVLMNLEVIFDDL